MIETNKGSKLWKVIKKARLSLEVVQGDDDFIDVVLSLPMPSPDRIPSRCPSCNKKSTLVLYESNATVPDLGVNVRFLNNIGYKVRGCPIRKWSEQKYKEVARKLKYELKTPETKLLTRCLTEAPLWG